MKQALINILNAIADRIKPKIYEYEFVRLIKVADDNKIVTGYQLIYFCKRTGSTKIIKV